MEIEELEQGQEQEQIDEQASADTAVKPDEAPAEDEAATTEETTDDEAQIADEILSGDLEQAEQQEHAVAPMKVVAELRASRRADRQLIDTLQTQLAERNRQPEAPPELSPIEKYYKDNPDLDPNIDAPPGGVIISDRKWQQQQQQQQQFKQESEARKTLGAKSTAQAQARLKDFDDVVGIGSKYLTEGNKWDIYHSDDPAMALYRLCARATIDSGSPDAALMRQMMQFKRTPKSKSVPATGSKEKPKTTTEKTEIETKPEVEPNTETEPMMTKELALIYASFGI